MSTETALELRTILQAKKSELSNRLAGMIDTDRFLSIAVSLYRRKGFEEISPEQFAIVTFRVAALALDIEPLFGHVYVVPFKRNGKPSLELIVGYQGHLELAWRTGFYGEIFGEVVLPGDEFEYYEGLVTKLHHVPAWMNGNHGPEYSPTMPPEYCYAVARDKQSNPVGHIVLPSIHVHKNHRDRSASYIAYQAGIVKSTPWVEHPHPMFRKTAILAMKSRLRKGSYQMSLAAELDGSTAEDDISIGGPHIIDIGARGNGAGGASPEPEKPRIGDLTLAEKMTLSPFLKATENVRNDTQLRRYLSQYDGTKQDLLRAADDWRAQAEQQETA